MTSNLNYALNAYRSAATYVRPIVAVVRLYDEVLQCIGRAIKDAQVQHVEECYINITKACLVMRGLSRNLDFDQDSEMADVLKSTYIANMIELHTAFGKPDASVRFLNVMEGLLDLRNAWAGVAGVDKVEYLSVDILRDDCIES